MGNKGLEKGRFGPYFTQQGISHMDAAPFYVYTVWNFKLKEQAIFFFFFFSFTASHRVTNIFYFMVISLL